MSIKPLPHHYAMENIPSVYDEEAMTALELAGRTTAKINEVIKDQNDLRTTTTEHLAQQDESLPGMVETTVQNHIDGGTFDRQLNAHMDNVDAELGYKVDKRQPGQVGMSMLSQEVKEAMTGGSVPVVGYNAVTSDNIMKGAVTPDKLPFVTSGFNALRNTPYSTDTYYNHGGTYKANIAGCTAFDYFPIYAGETYHYYNVRGYFSTISYEDGTKVAISNTDGTVSGSFTAEKNGWLYITINTQKLKDCAVWNYKCYSWATGDYINGVTMQNFIPEYGLFKKLGFRYTGNYTGEQLNGGKLNGNVLTIPTGNTGFNSYIRALLDAGKLKGKNGLFAINYTLNKNGSEFTENFGISIADTSGKLKFYCSPDMTVKEKDGSVTVFISGQFPADLATNVQIYLMSFNQTVVTADVTLTINDVYYMADSLYTEMYDALTNSDVAVNVSVTVAKDGTGDYTGLRECLEVIRPTSNKRYTVYVKPGTYELRDEYTAEEWTADTFKGLFVPDYCTIKGMGNREDVIIKATYDTKMVLPSVLNLSNTAGLENLTVIGNKTRYTVHDDFATGTAASYQRIVKNCVFIGNDTYYDNVYGTGTKQGADWYFENCTFINNNKGICFSNHNNTGFKHPCKIHFKNCRFTTNGDYAVRFGSLNTNANGILTYVTLEGCVLSSLYTGLLLFEENKSAYGAGILFKVSGFYNRGANYTIINTDGKDYTDCIDLI